LRPGCCGGAKPKKGSGCCNCFCGSPCCCGNKEKQKDVYDGKRWCFDIMIMCLLALTVMAGAVGSLGVGMVTPGLTNTADIFLFKTSELITKFHDALTVVNNIMDDNGMPASAMETNEQTCMLADFAAQIDDIKTEFDDNKDTGILALNGFVYASILLPVVLCILMLLAAFWGKNCCCRMLVCIWSLWSLLPILTLAISAAIMATLAVVTGDVCYEFGLHISHVKVNPGEPQSLVFLPPDIDPCASGGALNSLEEVYFDTMNDFIQRACDELATQCSDTASHRGALDCSNAVTDGLMTVSGSTYTGSCDYEDLATLQILPTRLMVKDVDVPTDGSTAGLPAAVATCITAYFTTGDGRVTDPNSGALVPNTAPTDDQVAEQAIQCAPSISVADCATSCSAPDMRALAGEMNTTVTDGATAAIQTDEQYTSRVQPLLRCSFLSDIFEAVYIPFCVDSPSGFVYIFMSNVMDGVAMVLLFMVGICLTKRLDPEAVVSGNEGATPLEEDDDDEMDQLMYKGSTERL